MEIDEPVTVLGLGAMGAALAAALRASGRPTTVWNRTPGKAAGLVAAGAREATDLATAIRSSPLVVACLWDHTSVHETLDPVADAIAGRVCVNLTNGTPAQGRELGGWAAEHGFALLDGGIMAIPPMIGKPEAFVLYSGPRAAFDAHRGALDTFGESRHVGIDHGLAAVYDLALLSAMYGTFMGELHAFALVRSAGIGPREFAPLLQRWAAVSDHARSAERIASGDYTRDVVSNLGMQAAGYHNLIDAAHQQGVSPELIAPLYPLLLRRAADGHGHEDLTSLVELLDTGRSAR